MSGTGFFENFESIDTSSEKGALNKEKSPPAPKVEEPKTVPTGFQEPPADIADRAMEAMPPEFHEKVEEMKEEFVENIMPTKPPVPEGSWMTTSTNPAWTQINAARGRATRSHKHVLCGIAGPPKSGKSGQVLDSLSEEEKAAGAEIHHIDFDAGGGKETDERT